MPRPKLYIFPEVEKRMLEMIQEGCSYCEIMQELRVSDYAILSIKRKHGLLAANPAPRRPKE